MAQGYYQANLHKRRACFHLFFRKSPFDNVFSIACGLANIIEFIKNWKFSDEDIDYLQSLKTPSGKPIFIHAFLQELKNLQFTGDLFAIPEGQLVFAQTPMLRIEAPIMICQLLESALLNLMNYSTLIASKAAQLYLACEGDPILEFGMRRAQGLDGALTGSRAAFIGGCSATSHVLAGQRYGIPVRGTHAHSWVSAFEDELCAFQTYANYMPEQCVLLVDTYDTIQGVHHAITVGKSLRQRGFDLYGVRLDSGDVLTLSRMVRKQLDEAGFNDTKIIASNALNANMIRELKKQKAPIDIWGIGTHLITAFDQPALDGVYKLSALQNENGLWEDKIKLSEQLSKTSLSGRLQIHRFFENQIPCADLIYDINQPLEKSYLKTPSALNININADESRDLLVPVFLNGNCVYPDISVHSIRNFSIENIHAWLKRSDMHSYPILEEPNYTQKKLSLIKKYRFT